MISVILSAMIRAEKGTFPQRPSTGEQLQRLDKLRSEISRPRAEFDAVIVIGQNWRKNRMGNMREVVKEKRYLDERGNTLLDWNNKEIVDYKSRIFLDIQTKANVLAAGELLYKKKTERLIFLGVKDPGKDPLGKKYPSQSKEMEKFFRIYFPENIFPPSTVITGEAEDFGIAESVVRIKDSSRIDNMAVLDTGYHAQWLKGEFNKKGVNISASFSSASILEKRSTHYIKLMGKFYSTMEYWNRAINESIGIADPLT